MGQYDIKLWRMHDFWASGSSHNVHVQCTNVDVVATALFSTLNMNLATEGYIYMYMYMHIILTYLQIMGKVSRSTPEFALS